MKGRLRNVVLFGSRARGDAGDGADYDVLLVVDARTPELRERLLDVEVEMLDRFDALFAPVLRTEAEWTASQGFPLAMNIIREGIPL